jgi:TetR/AcrR family transcriptional regulator, transcriptional repressor for nem operon
MLETRDSIVAVATKLAQTRGFNAFSYADISEAIGIRKASIHHHFPAKADLGEAMVAAYRAAFTDHLVRISAKASRSPARLKLYAELYKASLLDERMCLCGMLASDASTLPEPIQRQVSAFFAEHAAWLARTLEQGRRAGELAFEGTATARAKMLLASLQGALLVARGTGDRAFFEAAAHEALHSLNARR